MNKIIIKLLAITLILVAAGCHKDKKGEKSQKIYDPYKDAPGRVVKTTYPGTDQPCDVYIYRVGEDGKPTNDLLCHAGYHKNGSLYAEKKYENGIAEGVWNAYCDDGTLWATMTYRNGVQVGEEKDYYQNGKLRLHSFYNNGQLDGDVKEYYESGKLKHISHYTNGVQQGEEKLFFESGKLMMLGHFIDGNCTGEWKNFDEQGHVTKSAIAEEGKIICGNCPRCKAIRNGNSTPDGQEAQAKK